MLHVIYHFASPAIRISHNECKSRCLDFKAERLRINPFTATGYFDIPPPRWPTFLVTLFPILKEGMGLSLSDEFEVRYHVIKK